MQRILDIVLAGGVLIFVSPIIVLVVFVLRFSGEGRNFFRQFRIGKNGKRIKILKFVTMVKDSPYIGTGTVTLKDDPRVLPFGKILRKTKINELPQLFNVLTGDMSVIGPRPQTQRCFDAFPIECQNEIITVAPGLSGLGSIFFRNEELMLDNANSADEFYNKIIMPYKGELENGMSKSVRAFVF